MQIPHLLSWNIVKSGNWYWKYWWKNERKISFHPGDTSFQHLSLLKSNHSQASELPLPRKSTRLEYVTLGNFFHQKSYLKLISAILWIMETVDKSWQSFGGFESKTRYQFEPKLIIKHAAMKTATYPISYNQATVFSGRSFIFRIMIFWIKKQFFMQRYLLINIGETCSSVAFAPIV